MRTVEFRLLEHASPAGQVLAREAADLAVAMKDVLYRLTREAADVPGRGRAASALESLAQLRLSIPADGNRIVFTIGDPYTLDVDPLSWETDWAFWRLLAGVRDNARPCDVGPSLADAVYDLVGAIQRCTRRMEVTDGGTRSVVLDAAEVERSVWAVRAGQPEKATIEGVLESADLHSGRFNLRCDDGTRLPLEDVPEPASGAKLIGDRVRVAGQLFRGARTRMEVRRLDAVPMLDAPGATMTPVHPGQTEITDFLPLRAV